MIAGAETDRDAELVGIFRVTISIAIGVIREAGDLADVVAEVGGATTRGGAPNGLNGPIAGGKGASVAG